jgi:hypothetical protein
MILKIFIFLSYRYAFLPATFVGYYKGAGKFRKKIYFKRSSVILKLFICKIYADYAGGWCFADPSNFLV